MEADDDEGPILLFEGALRGVGYAGCSWWC
jgi:hypothetical protein